MLDDDSSGNGGESSSGEFGDEDETASSVMLNGPGFLVHNLNDISEVMLEQDTSDETSDTSSAAGIGLPLKTASQLSSSFTPSKKTADKTSNSIQHDAVKKSHNKFSENGTPPSGLENKAEERNQHSSNDPPRADTNTSQQMINVKMLDAENFSTEWEECPSLPPPPDHGLRTPIVHSLLDQWTGDASMQQSLLQWMESILSFDNGNYPSGSGGMAGVGNINIAPLTISSVDHQVREGLMMHVLPLLLRRADIHVKVMTRAHRRTTYDISVSVAPTTIAGSRSLCTRDESASISRSSVLRSKTDAISLMTFQASSGGSALASAFDDDEDGALQDRGTPTRFGGNHHPLTHHQRHASASYNAMAATAFRNGMGIDEDPLDDQGGFHHHHDNNSVTSSITGATFLRTPPRTDKEEKSVFLKAFGLGGAFGGMLMNRNNKASEGGGSHRKAVSQGSVYHHNNGVGLAEKALIEAGSDEHHHRVVAAPPGRIGMELVQFRGNVMVSNVAKESPLAGWVFASDILIAIDEVPVSGLRVHDIVNLLTSRADRHRALRVISSHAMDDLFNKT
jgi:hypothetical protein